MNKFCMGQKLKETTVLTVNTQTKVHEPIQSDRKVVSVTREIFHFGKQDC